MERITYLDFVLKLSGEAGQYSAAVLSSPSGEGQASFTLPFSAVELENLRLRMTRMRYARGKDSAEMEAARQLGSGLFQAVFQGKVRDCLVKSQDKLSEDTGLRIKLRLQDAPALAELPWEFLFNPDEACFLAQSTYTPIVRYLEFTGNIPPLKAALPLHILGVVANPSDYKPPLDVKDEQARLETALQELVQEKLVKISWLEQATLEGLRRRLRAGTYHIFHFIGHGFLDRHSEQGALVFTDEHGHSQEVSAERLGVVLHDHRSLRLAVLNACEGARGTLQDPFAGVAANLVRQGIPAVVAMQFEISDSSARAFAGEFYAALAQGLPVDAAQAEARKAIYCLPEDIEWGIPVLYLRSADGVLFELASPPAQTEQAPAARPAAPPSEQHATPAQPPEEQKVPPPQTTEKPQPASPQKVEAAAPETTAPPTPEKQAPTRATSAQKKEATPAQPPVEEKVSPPQTTEKRLPAGLRDMRTPAPKTPAQEAVIPADLYTFVHLPQVKGWIGKYPVTNLQYQRFLESEDFARQDYWMSFPKFGPPPQYALLGDWGDAGWLWLEAALKDKPLASDDRHVEPRRWKDETFGIQQPLAPVVGVTWYDANAYCRWLQAHWAEAREGQDNPGLSPGTLRLPTEREWIAAAGGDEPERRFPWDRGGQVTQKDEEIVRRANVKESRVEHTTPVNQYPQGQSPAGVWDLAGNVWEWLANYYEKDNKWLAIRGGAWYYDSDAARLSARGYNPPLNHWYIGGFRVFFSPS